MPLRITATLIAVSMISAACDMIMTPPPPTRTPRPTITPTLAVTPTIVLFFPSTAVIEAPASAPSSTDTACCAPAAAEAGLTSSVEAPTVTPSPTSRPGSIQSNPQPLAITDVLLVKVSRDPVRENGAMASIQVLYSGGRAPYRIYHDETLQIQNPFLVPAVCNGTLAHTIRLTSGDGQVVSKQYHLSPIECPP